MALSNRGDYLAFGDGDGQLHIWTTHDTGDHARDETGRLKLPPFHYDGGVSPEWPDQSEPQKTFTLEDRTSVPPCWCFKSLLTLQPSKCHWYAKPS